MQTGTDPITTRGGQGSVIAPADARTATESGMSLSWNTALIQTGEGRNRSSVGADIQSRQRVVYLDPRSLTRECIGSLLRAHLDDLDVECIASWPGRELEERRSGQVCAVVINSGAEHMSSSVVLELINATSEYFAAAPIILLSDHEDQESISRAFALGVKGFVPSNLTSLTVVAVVRLVCVGGSFAPVSALVRQAPAPATVSHGDVIHNVTSGSDVRFTQRQTQILCCLHHGLSNKLIAHQLSMSENTVKVHVRAIMKRLHATNRTQAVCLTRNLLRDLEPASGSVGSGFGIRAARSEDAAGLGA